MILILKELLWSSGRGLINRIAASSCTGHWYRRPRKKFYRIDLKKTSSEATSGDKHLDFKIFERGKLLLS